MVSTVLGTPELVCSLEWFSIEKLQAAFVIALYKLIDNVLLSEGEIIFYVKNE